MQDSIEQIKQEAENCKQCYELAHYRNKVAFSYGTGENGLMVIGIAPSYVGGNITGFPMSEGKSRSGELIFRILKRNDLEGKESYITNILFCATPKNREPSEQEVSNCIKYTKREMLIIKPKLVLLLGRVPSNAFFVNTIYGNRYEQYKIYQGASTIKYFSVPHPAYILKRNIRSIEDSYIDKISRAINKVIGDANERRNSNN